jgi:hypothetical protein
MDEQPQTGAHWVGLVNGRTPPDMVVLIGRIGAHMAASGVPLRTVHAPKHSEVLVGIVGSSARVYLPWGRRSDPQTQTRIQQLRRLSEAMALGAELFSDWEQANDFSRQARAALLFALLGEDLDTPAQFLVFFSRELLPATTPLADAATHGLEAAAVQVASHYGIGAYNLADANVRHRLRRRLDQLGA